MQRITVESTTLATLAYDAPQRQLELEFRNGAVYRYSDVPEGTYQELRLADSKGQYFNRHIRGRFPTRSVSSAPRKHETMIRANLIEPDEPQNAR